jgi:hypothetical protein
MTTYDEKYVVFKRKAWEEFVNEPRASFTEQKREMTKKALPDAVVFRTQDILAGPIFHTYASVYAAMAKGFSQDYPSRSTNLMSAADYISERAEEADNHPAPKYPD